MVYTSLGLFYHILILPVHKDFFCSHKPLVRVRNEQKKVLRNEQKKDAACMAASTFGVSSLHLRLLSLCAERTRPVSYYQSYQNFHLVPAEVSAQATRRVATRGKPHNMPKRNKSIPVDTEFIFTRATLSYPSSVQELLQNVFDCIIPVRDATPETLQDYISGLSASDYMSGAFDFAPDLTILPTRESN